MHFSPLLTCRQPFPLAQSEYVVSDLFSTDSLRSLYVATAAGVGGERAMVRSQRASERGVRVARHLQALGLDAVGVD